MMLELFSGTASFSKVMQNKGHQCVTIDDDPDFYPDICKDINTLDYKDICKLINYDFSVVWASPPCQSFSVAAISRNWSASGIPKSEKAKKGIELLRKTIEIINTIQPKYFFIENPRGMMRKIIDDIFRKQGIKEYHRETVSYCQYGDTRMKPTDIWTNLPDWKGRMCRNGLSCHVSAPRGSKTGTQGLKGAKERSVIPKKLFEEIYPFITRTKT